MKTFLTILIFGLGLIFASCQKPPEPATFPRDDEADNIGNSTKTPNYTFTDGFIYHEWKGSQPLFKEIPFTLEYNTHIKYYTWGQYNSKKYHPIKKR